VKQRCEWARGSALEREYHDKEWGMPVHDDTKLFEFLILEGMQAGLSWSTILKKRQGYVRAYDGFDARKIARYDTKKIKDLLSNPGIIRNRLKILASIANASGYLQVQEEFGSFDDYIWHFVDGKPKVNKWQSLNQIPDKTRESEAMSKDLKKRGFKFVGPTICYAFMQATGMVNDHTLDCFRYKEIINMYPVLENSHHTAQ
jgi:DNA-3-methyladenine glycosylase I